VATPPLNLEFDEEESEFLLSATTLSLSLEAVDVGIHCFSRKKLTFFFFHPFTHSLRSSMITF